nr:hypothetical protein [Streptomyces coryli]
MACAAVPFALATPAAAESWDRKCYGITAPYKGFNEIMGKVSKKGDCRDGLAMLQRHRWWGWEVVDERRLTGTSAGLMHKCTGSGTYTYKTVVSIDSQLGVYESESRRFTC